MRYLNLHVRWCERCELHFQSVHYTWIHRTSTRQHYAAIPEENDEPIKGVFSNNNLHIPLNVEVTFEYRDKTTVMLSKGATS